MIQVKHVDDHGVKGWMNNDLHKRAAASLTRIVLYEYVIFSSGITRPLKSPSRQRTVLVILQFV